MLQISCQPIQHVLFIPKSVSLNYGRRTRNGHPRNLPQRPRQTADKRDNQPNDPKHDTARAVLGECIHHDRECEDMAAHNKYQEEQLRGAQDFTPEAPQHDLAGIGHAVDVWVCELELAEDVAGVCSDEAEADDQDDAAVAKQRLAKLVSAMAAWWLGCPMDAWLGRLGRDLRDEAECGHG